MKVIRLGEASGSAIELSKPQLDQRFAVTAAASVCKANIYTVT